MHVGQHAGSIHLDDREWTAQDLVKLLAEHTELADRLAIAGVDAYNRQHELMDLRRRVADALAALADIPHSMLTVIRPEGDCPGGCPRCLINKVSEWLHR